MKMEIDVLILYAEKDNQPEGKNAEGWVSLFKKFFESMLIQVLGRSPHILTKSDNDSHISPNMDNALVVIAIMSENFVQSERCIQNISLFEKTLSVKRDFILRTFKVFKSPLPIQKQPDILQPLLGYEM